MLHDVAEHIQAAVQRVALPQHSRVYRGQAVRGRPLAAITACAAAHAAAALPSLERSQRRSECAVACPAAYCDLTAS